MTGQKSVALPRRDTPSFANNNGRSLDWTPDTRLRRPLLSTWDRRTPHAYLKNGADDESRTHAISLEGWGFRWAVPIGRKTEGSRTHDPRLGKGDAAPDLPHIFVKLVEEMDSNHRHQANGWSAPLATQSWSRKRKFQLSIIERQYSPGYHDPTTCISFLLNAWRRESEALTCWLQISCSRWAAPAYYIFIVLCLKIWWRPGTGSGQIEPPAWPGWHSGLLNYQAAIMVGVGARAYDPLQPGRCLSPTRGLTPHSIGCLNLSARTYYRVLIRHCQELFS